MWTQYFLNGDFTFYKGSQSSHRPFATIVPQAIQTRMTIVWRSGLVDVIV